MGDPARMRAVVLNLLTNAIKYSYRGGAIELSLEVEGNQIGNDLVFEVRDHGPGILAADLGHIF